MSLISIQKICKICKKIYFINKPEELLLHGNICKECRKKSKK